jgi:Fic family protein
MAQPLSNEPSFDRPIAGQSLTHELGARPWQNPSQYTTVDEAIDYYMERMSSEDFMVQLVDVLEMGVPVTTLANTIQMSNVMNGVHNLDVGMLVLPLIMEMLMMIGDSAEIEYNTGLDNPNEIKTSNPTRESLLTKVAMQYKDKLEEVDFENLDEETVEEEPTEEPTGLMARRN